MRSLQDSTVRTLSHAHGAVCEKCCYKVANRGNATLRAIGEFWYLASRACAIAIEDGATAVRDGLASKFKAKKLDHVHVPGELCARCITARQRSRVRAVEDVTHWIDTAVRLFAYAAMLVGGFIAGIAAMTMSLFPSSTRPSKPQVKTGGTGSGSGKDGDDHERGDGGDSSNSTDDSDDNVDDDKDSPSSLKREADPDFWDSYNKNVSELNSMAVPPVWNVHNDIHKDDHLVKELNSIARAVEDGKEDPRKLQQVAEELYKTREDKNRKDAKRDMLASKFLDTQAKARRCFDLAAIAQTNRDYNKRDRLAAEGESVWIEAKAIMAAFMSV